MHKALGLILLFASIPALAQLPPGQPFFGPAGRFYFHDEVRTAGPFQPPGHIGDSWYNYYIYLPDEPRPVSAPVVLLIPGYGAWHPDQYRDWIRHMVKMGYTVVWARADQATFAVWAYLSDAEAAWNDALTRLQSDPDLIPPRRRHGQMVTAIVGHSIGGWIGPAMASRAGKGRTKYPPPKAVVAITPGQGFLLDLDFSGILSDTKFVITVGDQDSITCTGSASKLWAGTHHMPNANRDLLFVQSDRRVPGMLGLSAHHMYPTGLYGIGVDNMDFQGLWKPSVATLNCGIYGEDCSFALGNGSPEQVGAGYWSDGQPFKPMIWVPDADSLPEIQGCPQ